MKLAIIGAGIGGLTLARALHGMAEVTVFEKARGVGGRMATRRAQTAEGVAFSFDHGAQAFTARSSAFRRFLLPLMVSGVVGEWHGKAVQFQLGKPGYRPWFETHLVALPGMSGLCKHMSEGVDVRLSTEILPLQREGGKWALHAKDGTALGTFDWVISTAPPTQTQNLLGPHLPSAASVANAPMQACYALMLGWARPWAEPWIAARLRASPLKWVSVDSAKPGRNAAQTCLVAQSRAHWAAAHLEDDPQNVQSLMLDALQQATGLRVETPDYASLHRWRYALVDKTAKPGPYVDTVQKLAAVSDWSATSRVEEVWLAARELAERLREMV